MSKKNELVTSSMFAAAALDQVVDLGDSGAGLDTIDTSSCAMPMFSIVEKLSEVADRDSAKYIDGVKPGDFYNTVTNEIFTTVNFIPVAVKHTFVEWTPETKGVPVAEHSRTSSVVARAIKKEDGNKTVMINPDTSNHLVETITLAVVYEGVDGASSLALIPFSKTRLKRARHLLTEIKGKCVNGIQVPLYRQIYKLFTEKLTKDSNTWYSYKTDFVGVVNDKAVADELKAIHESTKAMITTDTYASENVQPSSSISDEGVTVEVIA